MRPRLALAVVMLLGGCGLVDDYETPPGWDRPEAAACRDEARRAANALDLSRQVNPGNRNQEEQFRQRRLAEERRAFVDCQRRTGLIRGGGGVEPVRRSGGIF